jgi:hypothetical protein
VARTADGATPCSSAAGQEDGHRGAGDDDQAAGQHAQRVRLEPGASQVLEDGRHPQLGGPEIGAGVGGQLVQANVVGQHHQAQALAHGGRLRPHDLGHAVQLRKVRGHQLEHGPRLAEPDASPFDQAVPVKVGAQRLQLRGPDRKGRSVAAGHAVEKALEPFERGQRNLAPAYAQQPQGRRGRAAAGAGQQDDYRREHLGSLEDRLDVPVRLAQPGMRHEAVQQCVVGPEVPLQF